MPGLYVCVVEREEIRTGLERGESLRQIGRQGAGVSYRAVETDSGTPVTTPSVPGHET